MYFILLYCTSKLTKDISDTPLKLIYSMYLKILILANFLSSFYFFQLSLKTLTTYRFILLVERLRNSFCFCLNYQHLKKIFFNCLVILVIQVFLICLFISDCKITVGINLNMTQKILNWILRGLLNVFYFIRYMNVLLFLKFFRFEIS